MKRALSLYAVVSACAGPAKPKQSANEAFLASACPHSLAQQQITLEQGRKLDICRNPTEKFSVARLCQVAAFLAHTAEYKDVKFSIEPGDPWTEAAVTKHEQLLQQLRAGGATSTGVLYSDGGITISVPQHLEFHCVQKVEGESFVIRFDGIAVRTRMPE